MNQSIENMTVLRGRKKLVKSYSKKAFYKVWEKTQKKNRDCKKSQSKTKKN